MHVLRFSPPIVVAAIAGCSVVQATPISGPSPGPQSSAAQITFNTPIPWYNFDVPHGYTYCQASYPSASTYTAVPNAELELVQLVVRHGDRTPNAIIPHEDTTWTCDGVDEDTYLHIANPSAKNTTGSFKQVIEIPKWNGKFGFENQFYKGSCESGELTDKGKFQHFQLGSQLRSIYVDKLNFLPKKLYDSDIIHFRSTYVWRTKNSGESLIGNLYPGRSIESNVAIPLHTYPQSIETMHENPAACPKIKTNLAQMTASAQYQNFLKDQAPLMKRLQDIMGMHTSDYTTTWYVILDVLITRKCHGFKYPCNSSGQCATEDDVEQVIRNANFELAFKYRDSSISPEYTRLGLGSFLGTLKEQMQSFVAGNTGKLKLSLSTRPTTPRLPLSSVP
ncbi:phosphoglycerate mutase-like protein [Linderina pennispora]|uniref:Phosphoglycerate mutase-like protein n=1 Tax=Linderina pennispora TaxID=61395 RepID=A0A1Y1WIN0_9FUNG|nr:phosphoglycerate mutase-like protein [Linderina pennispora]ORX72954.1 phosphoglycerate mutase-like protein [Linderina pennispora]